MTGHVKTIDAMVGRWGEFLPQLGLPQSCLINKHTTCPLCQGKGKFRYDDLKGRGTYICNNCGANDGMDLAMKFTNVDFKTLARQCDAFLANSIARPHVENEVSTEHKSELLRETYNASSPIKIGDLADQYLKSRKIALSTFPKHLRFAKNLPDGEGGFAPTMLGVVSVYPEPKGYNIHRTFLRQDGSGKAPIQSPRKFMPGKLPNGACVVLSDYVGGPLGIAEGIETALSASILFDMPVWAALSASMLRKWRPPNTCQKVIIFGDSDAKFAGQAAAYDLANKLSLDGVAVKVMLPDQDGVDWNDILVQTQERS